MDFMKKKKQDGPPKPPFIKRMFREPVTVGIMAGVFVGALYLGYEYIYSYARPMLRKREYERDADFLFQLSQKKLNKSENENEYK